MHMTKNHGCTTILYLPEKMGLPVSIGSFLASRISPHDIGPGQEPA
jgi:hypothetical protein